MKRMIEPEITVQVEGKPLALNTKGAYSVCVGQKITLLSSIPGNWSANDPAIADYVVTSLKGEVVPFNPPPAQQQVTIIWWQVEKPSITFAADAQQVTLTFDVEGPDVEIFDRTGLGQVIVESYQQVNKTKTYLLLAGADRGFKNGIQMAASVFAPAHFIGTLCGIQVLKGSRTYTFRANQPAHVTTTHGQWALDNGQNSDTFAYQRTTVPLTSGPQIQIDFNDAPASEVDNLIEQLVVVEEFRMYLMFKPDGQETVWIPLQRLDWMWKGDTTYDPNGYWGLAVDNTTCSADRAGKPVKDFQISEAFPQWAANILDLTKQ